VSPAKKTPVTKKPSAKPTPERLVELLFEVGCEEIPAGMLPRAEAEIKAGLEKQLTAENLMAGVTVESFSTPRRLTLWARGLSARQADVVNEVTGPPKSVAYDVVGAPTRAAVSFPRSKASDSTKSISCKLPRASIWPPRMSSVAGPPRISLRIFSRVSCTTFTGRRL